MIFYLIIYKMYIYNYSTIIYLSNSSSKLDQNISTTSTSLICHQNTTKTSPFITTEIFKHISFMQNQN